MLHYNMLGLPLLASLVLFLAFANGSGTPSSYNTHACHTHFCFINGVRLRR